MTSQPVVATEPVALIDFPADLRSGSPQRERLAFSQPRQWLIATSAAQVRPTLDQAEALARQGLWCIGWVAYEAVSGLQAILPCHPATPGQPLAVFAVFDKASSWPDEPLAAATWSTADWQASGSADDFAGRIERIHELIRAGEVYQINLTAPYRAELTPPQASTPRAYFHALHASQPLGFGCYFDMQGLPAGAPSHVLSVSPELFFDWQAQRITTRPMKGTAPRHASPQADAAAAEHLRTSDKEKAENLMIVDLLRNDLSVIAETGSVQVPALFDVEPLPTVWQMTSTITANTRAGTSLSDVFTALFPCGSITGAPKRRAMHHITQLEDGPRGVYCGAVGLIRPGGHATFNVPIRTVTLQAAPSGWAASCGIGSGVTIDAQAAAEAHEWWHKQAFLRRAARPFDVLESLRLDNGAVARLDAHLARLSRSAQHFGRPCDVARVTAALQQLATRHPQGVFKVRLLLDADGGVRCEAAPLTATHTPVRLHLARKPMPPADEFITHKTTRREAYAPFAPPAGCFDTLLWNEAGQLTECTIGNIAVQLHGEWVTPPLSCGLLPGVMRETLLQQGRLQERIIETNDLWRATGAALLNSVRGWLEVDLADLLAQAAIHPHSS
ncbi:chorismate-binding protein [Aquabacterium sp.]|uniref:chorismate-binding protein n=1 Tax=Aquabacterium sp. TaxID=1872578 RepID=UPI0035B13003